MNDRLLSGAQAPEAATVVDRCEWARFMTDDEYYPFLVKKNLRPAIWRWEDLQPRLAEVLADPLRRADRRFIALVNDDTGEAGGVFPSIFLGIQTFAPGEHIVAHRHNSYALYHILQGEGYSVLDGQRFDWKRGDTFACPPMASHEHINTGREPAIQYVIQDMPARAMDRNLIWEEPIGRLFHMVEGKAPHQD
jgi:gentisate 1,2-dioxygenase